MCGWLLDTTLAGRPHPSLTRLIQPESFTESVVRDWFCGPLASSTSTAAIYHKAEALSKPHGHHEARYRTSLLENRTAKGSSSLEALLGSKCAVLWHASSTPSSLWRMYTRPAITCCSAAGDKDPWNIVGSSMSVLTTFTHNAFPHRGAYFF